MLVCKNADKYKGMARYRYFPKMIDYFLIIPSSESSVFFRFLARGQTLVSTGQSLYSPCSPLIEAMTHILSSFQDDGQTATADLDLAAE